MQRYLNSMGWFALAIGLLVNCLPAGTPSDRDRRWNEGVLSPVPTDSSSVIVPAPHKFGAVRQTAIIPTGNGFFKVASGVPIGGADQPTGARVDLSSSADVFNVLSYTNGGTGLSALGPAGTALCVNGSATGYTSCAIGGGGGGSSAGASGTVQLSDGAGGFIAATNVFGGTSFLSAGTSVANAGAFRGANNTPLLMGRNAANSANISAADTDTSNNLYVGETSAGTSQASLTIINGANGVILKQNNASVFAASSTTLGAFVAQGLNLSVLGSQSSPSFGGGAGVLYMGNATTVPTSNATNGGVIYAESGSLKYRGSTGLVTSMAPTGIQRLSFVVATAFTMSATQNGYGGVVASGATNGSSVIFQAPTGDADTYYRFVHAGRDTSCSPSGSCTGTMTIKSSGGGTTVPLTTDEYSCFVMISTTGATRLTPQTQ